MEYEERGFSKDVLHREVIPENVVSHNNDLTDMRSSESRRVFKYSWKEDGFLTMCYWKWGFSKADHKRVAAFGRGVLMGSGVWVGLIKEEFLLLLMFSSCCCCCCCCCCFLNCFCLFVWGVMLLFVVVVLVGVFICWVVGWLAGWLACWLVLEGSPWPKRNGPKRIAIFRDGHLSLNENTKNEITAIFHNSDLPAEDPLYKHLWTCAPELSRWLNYVIRTFAAPNN